MDSNVLVKPVFSDQSEKVIKLILPIQQIEFNVQVTLEDQPDLVDIDNYYHKTGGCFWGAFANGELIGTIALINIGNNSGAIRKMFVKKDLRGKESGIAQRLLETLLNFAKDKNITTILLGTVPVLKAALRFYERNGFKEIEEKKLPSYFPRMKADTVFYCYDNS